MGVALFLLTIFPAGQAAARPALIPMPSFVEWRAGAFEIKPTTRIHAKGKAATVASYLSRELGLKVGKKGLSAIRLKLVSDKVVAGKESYRLRVTAHEVSVEASDLQGLFYGAQTLRQLVELAPSGSRTVQSVNISDAPRFRWRGLLIDVGRHFFGKPTLLRIIDEMAVYKLNVLHLHLTDDTGWRLEIPGYPKLTEIGAMGDRTQPDSKDRQYFTTKEMREIVAYAAERHIMVVPEIEMPGHAGAAAKAYPEYFDGKGHFNPANANTYDFIRGVLSQVAAIFPAPIIHFGGDEIPDDAWKDRADVARLQSEHGLKTTNDVEAYFAERVAGIIRDVGKRPMAWDEQAESGVAKDVVIHWWRKDRPDILGKAARAGYDLVLSPVDQVYFDYAQGPGEPGAPWEGNDNGPTSIAKIIAWEPVPSSFSPAEEARILGVEAAVWTEFIKSERYLEFMTFPRLLAFAEVAWSPREGRDEKEFSARLQPHTDSLKARGIDARQGSWDAFDFLVH